MNRLNTVFPEIDVSTVSHIRLSGGRDVIDEKMCEFPRRLGRYSAGASLQKISEKKEWTVLVIDDEESMHDSCTQVLSREGHRILTAYFGDQGLSIVREERPDLVLLDLKLPRSKGTDILTEIHAIDPTIVTVVITGYATIESAVEAMKLGASDFLPKPFTPDELRMIVKRGLEKRSLLVKTRQLEDENNRLRENFVSIITHEMRSPLVAVEQYIEVLLEGIAGTLTDKQKDILSQSKRRIKWILSLVNEWLSMARIQDTVVLDSLDTIDIDEVLRDSYELVSVQAEEKHVHTVFTIPDGFPVIQGNRESLVHLFMNLFSNAIKYNREYGSITTIARDEDDSVCIAVTDTGFGIPQESLPFIFDEFFRVRAKERESMVAETGTGLGLAIVKKIVDAHRGYISVKSESDEGTTFRVHLPKNQMGNKKRKSPGNEAR